MKKILVVDDDQDIFNLVHASLSADYDLTWASDISSARSEFSKEEFDFIILDEMLPDGRGSEFCHYVKQELKRPDLPIVMLTSQKELENKLNAFQSGADDYITKPFEPLELKARIQARLRTSHSGEANIMVKGDLRFDLSTQALSLEISGVATPVDMTPIEFKILYLMAKQEGTVMSREVILTEIWGKSNFVVDRTVDQHISKIRKKIGPSQYTIKSSHGKGYRFLKERD
ncbi:MAG: DNA-binding response OmpR family regulator [Bacteriovoracaceae bacterium]|jgi:DNA-binding response OmpR family regulator